MTSESFGCHDISRRRWGGPAGGGAASACRSGLTRSLWRCKALSGRTARGWGATGRGSGALWVGGAFVQYAQPLASRSRASWSRPTHADSGRGRRLTMTTGPQRRRQPGSGAGGPVTEAPGSAARAPDSLLSGPVSTALTLTGPTPKYPTGIVGILRFLSGERRRGTRDVSTMDTHTPSCLASRPPSLPGPPPCPGFMPERVSHKS